MSAPSLMTYKGYAAIITLDADDEIFVGRVLGINDVIGFDANSVKGLKAAFHEAVDDYIATCAKVGKHPEKRASGNLMLRVAPEVHARATVAAEASSMSLNQWAEEIFRIATEGRLSPAYKAGSFKTPVKVGRDASTGAFTRRKKRPATAPKGEHTSRR